MTDDLIIQAIHNDRLNAVSDPTAIQICASIGSQAAASGAQAIDLLVEGGVSANDVSLVEDSAAPAQRHEATISVADADTALAAARVLEDAGYRPWDPIDGAAGEIVRLFQSRLTLARTEDYTTLLHLEWPAANKNAQRVPAVLVPTAADHEALGSLPVLSKLPTLPAKLWPLLFGFRPLRLIAERVMSRGQGSKSSALGPFLSTPQELIEPLLDLAEVSEADVVVDIGCGDARILVEAAKRGCRCIGVERDVSLVSAGRRRASTAGVSEQVEIIEGNAFDASERVAEGTVFFVFVPAEAAVGVVRDLLSNPNPNRRIVAHEQHRLPNAPEPTKSVPLLAGQGVTVAHLWRG